MPSVYAIVIVAIASVVSSTNAMAQIPVGTMRRAAPAAKVDARRPADTDTTIAEAPKNPADDERSRDTADDGEAEPSVDAAGETDDGDSGDDRTDLPADGGTLQGRAVRPKPTVSAAPMRAQSPKSETAASADNEQGPPDVDAAGSGARVTEAPPEAARRSSGAEPVAFRELKAGISTVTDLDAKWGKPVNNQSKLGTGQRTYEFAPFKRIVVTLNQGKVASIAAHFAQAATVNDATAEFMSGTGNPVEVTDDRGQALGLAFPEHGAVLAYAAAGKSVTQILFDPIDPETFLMRAKRDENLVPQKALADLAFVLAAQPTNDQAHWLSAKICLNAGRLRDAAEHVDAALKNRPNSAAYILTKSEVAVETGDFATGTRLCEEVLKHRNLTPELKARALCLLGDYLANGPTRDYKQAIERHLSAVQTAEPLSLDARVAVRRTSKEVLVAARLGIANDIAWGFWQQKEKVVPKWLATAHDAAEDLIDHEGADESLHLRVLRRALAASAGTQGKLDPATWTKDAVKTARRLIDTSEDPWRRARLEWELGLALYDALQADQARGYHDHALANSSLVVKYLESALEHRQETPHGAYVLGRLYFRIGTIYAVELNDHRAAVTWFEKALPLLERPLPATAVADLGRLGESFVSIGISYWETGRRDEAMQLTQRGIDLITKGVNERLIGQDALSVPYTNLAFMHRELGHAKQAAGYAEMATRLEGTRRQ